MDIGLKDWLIIGGIIVFGLIIVDGWRRMHRQGGTLKMDIDRKFVEQGEGEHNPELPNGGARPKKHEPTFKMATDYVTPVPASFTADGHTTAELDPLFDEIPANFADQASALSQSPERQHHSVTEFTFDQPDAPLDSQVTPLSQPDLDFGQPVTMLVAKGAHLATHSDEVGAVVSLPAQPDEMADVGEVVPNTSAIPAPPVAAVSPEPENGPEGPASLSTSAAAMTPAPAPLQAEQGLTPHDPPEPAPLTDQQRLLQQASTARKAREQMPDPEDVLVITVVGKDQPLPGEALLQVVLACGMRYGDMQLFHRFEQGIDQGAVQFSMANAVNPGTFDLENMAQISTPGVSFFMSMSEPEDPKNAFECMLATAETVAKHLGGDLLDENRSVMRPQTKAHYRERLNEFEMHRRVKPA